MTNTKTFEYHVVLIQADKLEAISGPILGTDNLAVACSYCYNHWHQFKQAIAVYQPAKGYWREYYMESNELEENT